MTAALSTRDHLVIFVVAWSVFATAALVSIGKFLRDTDRAGRRLNEEQRRRLLELDELGRRRQRRSKR